MPQFSRYHQRRQDPLRRPPPAGRCLINGLPDELWLDVLSYLDWEELIAIRRTSRRLSTLVLSPSLHRSVTIPCLSSCHLPHVLRERILPHARHLYLTDAPSKSFTWVAHRAVRVPVVMDAAIDLLRALPPDRLLTLSLRCFASSTRWDLIGEEIARVGGILERLDLHGARLESPMWCEWMKSVGVRGNGLRELDLGVSSITTLSPKLPWDHLEVLSLRSCYLLQSHDLSRFLSDLPPTLRSLNLSYLSQLSLDTLYDMRVTTTDDEGKLRRTALETVHLVGIDHFTKSDVRALQQHWSAQRASCSGTEPAPEARHPTIFRWPCRSDSADPHRTDPPPPHAWGSPSTPPALVPRTPHTPESVASEVMPATPDSVHSLYRARRPSPELSGTWEFGALGDAMYSPKAFGVGISPPLATDTVPAPLPAPSTATTSAAGALLPSPALVSRPKRTPAPSDKVTIFHSALLETDDEDGYRRFIGEVVDGTLGADWGELRDEGGE